MSIIAAIWKLKKVVPVTPKNYDELKKVTNLVDGFIKNKQAVLSKKQIKIFNQQKNEIKRFEKSLEALPVEEADVLPFRYKKTFKQEIDDIQNSYLENLDKRIMDEMDLTKADLENMSSTVLDDLRRSAEPVGMRKQFDEITEGRGLGDFPDDPLKDPDYAQGGIAGELRLHRQGYAGGKKVDLDRRMILKGMGALAALPVVGKFFKLAKPLAKVRDIRVKMKTDMDWSYEGPESGWEGGTWLNVDFIPLTKKGTKILDDLAKNKKISKIGTHGDETLYGVSNSEDGLMAVEDIKKMKGNMELETSVHDKVKGSVKGEYDTTKVYSGKDIDSKKILRESSDLADFPYHDNVFQDEFTEEIISTMGSRVKKVSGGLVDLLRL